MAYILDTQEEGTGNSVPNVDVNMTKDDPAGAASAGPVDIAAIIAKALNTAYTDASTVGAAVTDTTPTTVSPSQLMNPSPFAPPFAQSQHHVKSASMDMAVDLPSAASISTPQAQVQDSKSKSAISPSGMVGAGSGSIGTLSPVTVSIQFSAVFH